MCGINLILDKQHQLHSDDAIRKMVAASRHRGPDAESWVRSTHGQAQLFIGNNRLKILDLSPAGNQPMQCSEGGQQGDRYTLSYNGELYNHFGLKNELLQRGYTFHSTSDTEVLLYALAEWGESAISRLEGMFAFIFYDKLSSTLLMARDPRGMKPLYYAENEGYLLASSELQSLFAAGLFRKQLNEEQLYHYLQFRYARKPFTFYKQVYELLPGHLLNCSPTEKISIRPFRQPKQAEESSRAAGFSEAALADEVEEKLTDSLFNHLHADRGCGLFLSGGIDSTLMLALLRHHGSQLPVCYTIANSEKEAAWGTQDYRWASRAAKQYEAYHIPVTIDASVLEQFPAFIAAQDQPIGDGAAWLTAILSREAVKQNGLVLSGAGADELFGGYNRHQAFYTYLKYHKQAGWMLPAIKSLGALIPGSGFSPLRKPLRLMKKFAGQTSLSPSETYINYLSFATDNPQDVQLQPEAGDFTEGWMQAALQHDRDHYLVSDVLALNDKAAMQHSLEMRMPYLDQQLWTFATSLPASLHLQHGRKWIPGRILAKYGGQAYVNRKKEGFGMPFGLWVKEGKTEGMWEWLGEADHVLLEYLRAADVREMLVNHKKGREDFTQELFSLTVLAHWLAKEFS